jgi:hypothetical protein
VACGELEQPKRLADRIMGCALATRIHAICDGHRPAEVMTAITMVSAFLAQDALDLSAPAELEKFVARFADTLRIALQQDQARGTMQ